MRRPHIFERLAPRAKRDVEQECGDDYAPVARSVLGAPPTLLREAEAAGAITLAQFLEQALTEAESIVRRTPRHLAFTAAFTGSVSYRPCRLW
jgi:hypothetical protein